MIHAPIQEPAPLFLDLTDIAEGETHVRLTYHVSERLKPFRTLQTEEYAVKLAICHQLMQDQVLAHTTDYVSLHPSTLFYYPMQTVRYTYRANAVMPREAKWLPVKRYQALILSVLTGVSYEICLTDTASVSRKGNALIQSIAEARTPQELTAILADAYNFVVYAEIQNRTTFTSGFKKKTLYGFLTSAVLVLAAVGVTRYWGTQERATVVAALEAQVVQQEQEIRAQNHLLQGEYTQAVQLYAETGKDPAFLADLYFQNGFYQEALNLDPTYLEPVVQILFTTGEHSRIIDLTLLEEAGDLQELLQLGKHIVAYNTEALLNALPFLESEATATASCTTNGLALMTKILVDEFGIQRGLMSGSRAYTATQNMQDASGGRKSRAGAQNVIPVTTGAANALGKVIPEVKGIITGTTTRVPVITAGFVELFSVLDREVTVDQINEVMKAAANDSYGYTEDEIVSSDVVGDTHGSVFDATLTEVLDANGGQLVKTVAWYDNEYGFVSNMIRLVEHFSKLV